MRKTTLGSLKCIIFDPPKDSAPKRIVMLSHGFGAPGNDLVPLAGELVHIDPSLEAETQFIFPAAPLSLASMGIYGGLAWWMIDLESRIEAFERGDFDILRNDEPEGMAEVSDALLAATEDALSQAGLDASRLIIGGFSQGSMVSTDVALRMKDRPAGLAVLSGTLICEARWKELADRRGPLPVLQTHGHFDQILPYQCAEWLKEMFENAGFPLDFRPFPGRHEIPYTALEGLVDLIRRAT